MKGEKLMPDKKPYEPSEIAQRILDVLADADEMSLAEINAVLGGVAKPGHVSILSRQGLIRSKPVEAVCPTCGHKSKFHVYSLIR